MNHRWKKLDDKNSVCRVCGCERELENFIKDGFFSSYYIYIRSVINYNTERPDGIDWAKENEKTID